MSDTAPPPASAPTLRLHNTLARAKQDFRPIDPANVRLYACGPTVYDRAHVGNARPLIVFDVLFRLLRHLHGEAHVTYARNVTDVDDKINARAAERRVGIRELTDATLADFREDVKDLGCLPPTHEPRATDHIPEMVALIDRLLERHHAYIDKGEVIFEVKTMSLPRTPPYGRLSNRPPEAVMPGSRVAVKRHKRSPLDFVLWKSSAPGEPGWPGPKGIDGMGRPGWHIECSAMSMKALLEPFGGGLACDDPLKNTFDIHAGGLDLIFPHHENEIAQSCCALGTGTMANYWLHNGFLQVEGRKMSKSEGNFVTIHQLLHTEDFGGRRWPGDVLRLAMLRTHYREPIDWTVEALETEERRLRGWRARVRDALVKLPPEDFEGVAADETFLKWMLEDMNTPVALMQIDKLGPLVSRTYQGSAPPSAATIDAMAVAPPDLQALRGMVGSARLIGIDLMPRADGDAPDESVKDLLAGRAAARGAKDWAKADRLRDRLLALGWRVEDKKDGTSALERAR